MLVTHNLKHKNGADNIIILQEGKIIFDGKPTEVKEEIIKEIELETEKPKEKTEEDDEDDNEISKLIKAPGVGKRKVYSEVKKAGKVDFEVIKKYFRFGGGFFVFSGIALLFILVESAESVSTRLFANW